ncbi:MAG: DUF3419 family protein [Planctomycetes bacterium]|nr:DUF3419 family protein [Planctomycetota bacterium]
MSDTLPPWVVAARDLPLAFAQVREDPRIDQYVVARAGPAARVCMVASGGCTAVVLATMPTVAALHLVDANPAQLALARLKLRLLETADEQQRAEVIGQDTMPESARRTRLEQELSALGLAADVLGPPAVALALGPDHQGRYERCFAALQCEIEPHDADCQAVLALTDPTEQARRVAPGTSLGRAIDVALDSVMSLPNLVALFGEGATRNPVEPFSRHFARRIRYAFATLPARTNPFLWQMLAGVGQPDWLALPAAGRMPEVTWRQSFMADALREHVGAFDVVHLSNILDWLSPDEATSTLEVAARALRPGGQVVVRQLNSTLDIPASGPMFAWDDTRELHAADRSFFYRALHLGRKR